MGSVKVDIINPDIIRELATKFPEDAEKARKKYKSFDKWLRGEDFPTYNQLLELSKIFNVPFGDFFLEKLPEIEFPIPHYRTFKRGSFQPSKNLKDAVLHAQKVKNWAREILIEFGHERLPFAGKYKDNFDVEAVVDELKNLFDVKEGLNAMSRWVDAFNYLVDRVEEKGIIVIKSSYIENTHRVLDVKEFRGFVLYDDIAPVVFINNKDSISAKIFTLIHEVVHVLIGQSASFDLEELRPADVEVERFCDKCTAEFLVPEMELRRIYKPDVELEELAKHFKVSRVVILRRLLDLGFIDEESYSQRLRDLYMYDENKYEEEETKKKGGDYYANVVNYWGRRFLKLMIEAVNSGIILYTDLLDITKLSFKKIEKLINEGYL